MKLRMLKPRVRELEPRVKELGPRVRETRPTGRDANPRRTIPLNSSAWRRLREQVLARDPICHICFAQHGRITVATDVDHINGDPSDNDMGNLQGLCHSCHSRKTRRELNGSPSVWGCDVDGWPLDPSHHWKITGS